MLYGKAKRIHNRQMGKYTDSEVRLIINRAEREWIEANPYINAFNYWYYRYFTNDFEIFILSKDEF